MTPCILSTNSPAVALPDKVSFILDAARRALNYFLLGAAILAYLHAVTRGVLPALGKFRKYRRDERMAYIDYKMMKKHYWKKLPKGMRARVHHVDHALVSKCINYLALTTCLL